MPTCHDIDARFLNILPRAWRKPALRLALLLRLAVLLNRSRSAIQIPDIGITVGEQSIDLRFDGKWLQENPLTIADLDREIGYAQNVDYTLTFS